MKNLLKTYYSQLALNNPSLKMLNEDKILRRKWAGTQKAMK